MSQVPVADAARRRVEDEVERAFPVRTGGERQGLVERVTEPGIDVPGSRRVPARRQPADREDQVIAHRLLVGPAGPVDTADVTGDCIAK